MKRLFYLMLVVLGTAAFTACSDDDDNNGDGNGNDEPIQTPVYHYGEITMISDDSNLSSAIYTFNVGDTITIDYGDGYVQQAVANESYEEYDNEGNVIAKRGNIHLDYTYSDREEHTITIKGNISGLYCIYEQLTSLDVSKCTALTYLDCGNNELTSLDITKNTALTYLDCRNNELTSLDVTKNTALTYLNCSSHQLTSLDVTKNTALTYLDCRDNQLTSLDITKNTALTSLDCAENQLTSLDVTKNTALTYLSCKYNQFTAAEMNKIYEALPTVEDKTLWCDRLGNPSIAEQKGWEVIFD